MVRRWLAPVALAAITIGAAVGALMPARTRTPSRPAVAARAGVLSPRRLPDLLARAVADGNLHRRLDGVLADTDLGAGRTDSCLIVTYDGDTIYDTRPDRALTPASTLKLLTAAVALKRLGADSRLDTTVVAKTAPNDGVVAGDLWLVGGGDPLLGTADYAGSFKDQPRLFTDLAALADSVARAGVRTVTGGVVGDETRYDTQRYVPSWKPVYASDGDVGPLSALAFDDGFVEWKPKAIAAPAPATRAAAVFTELLKARGVTINAAPADGRAPAGARTVATLPSLPLRQVVGEMLIHSDNESAELLTKELGRRFGAGGTTTAGVAVIRKTLTDLGLNIDATTMNDGSGLDPADKVTCSLLLSLITGPTKDDLLAAGLAVAARTGTLFDRLLNTAAAERLRAKTGTLEGVLGLAGLVDPIAPNKQPLTFAFLANSLPRPSEARGKRLQQRLGEALAAYPDAPTAASLAP
ncbi:MAG TPA: D-alanyl-D-alanine carboxypeptidase [Acidimicrobiales bacterium]|nr:D-alanyl-D-alanine carboxypeptidase [Acidimicrobiales bacterium]